MLRTCGDHKRLPPTATVIPRRGDPGGTDDPSANRSPNPPHAAHGPGGDEHRADRLPAGHRPTHGRQIPGDPQGERPSALPQAGERQALACDGPRGLDPSGGPGGDPDGRAHHGDHEASDDRRTALRRPLRRAPSAAHGPRGPASRRAAAWNAADRTRPRPARSPARRTSTSPGSSARSATALRWPPPGRSSPTTSWERRAPGSAPWKSCVRARASSTRRVGGTGESGLRGRAGPLGLCPSAPRPARRGTARG